MSTALFSVTVVAKRMLSRKEAAEHCGRSLKQFQAECPVAPVKFANGDLRWDVRDLDAWLDKVKGSSEDSDAIIQRLASHDRGSR